MSNRTVNLIVLGEMGVGKTSMLLRYTEDTFKPNHASTIIECFKKEVEIGNKIVKLNIWDTAGQERFRAIVKEYFRKADGVFLVYDVTDITTFNKLSKWLMELKKHNEDAVVVIVGNKIDDIDKKAVSASVVKSFAEQEKMDYFETSCKDGTNVNEVFELLTMKVLDAIHGTNGKPDEGQQSNVNIPKKSESFASTKKRIGSLLFAPENESESDVTVRLTTNDRTQKAEQSCFC